MDALIDTSPNSLMDSTANLKGEKQQKDKELGHIPWFVTLWGKGVC